MIGYHQSIHANNVVSCLYLVDLVNLSEAFEDFVTTITSAGYTPSGQLFYSINSDLRQKQDMMVELFLPIEETSCELDDRFIYRTYFQLNDMIVTRVKGEKESDFQKGLQELIEEIVAKDLTPKTPTFYKIFVNEEGENLTDIMIGIRE